MHVINVLSHILDAYHWRTLLYRHGNYGHAHHLDYIFVYFFTSTFAKEYKSDDETQMRGLRGREVISGRKLAKNCRKLVSIKGTVNLINSVRRGASRITATAAKAVGAPGPSKKRA